MCISPGILTTGQVVPCRKCWQCLETKVDDWVGRCIAESKTALATNFVTLTYGRDENYEGADTPRAAVLTYSDVQKFFKRLRKNGFPMRYFCVGEYGSLKGRAHWHIIVFWTKRVPKLKLDARVDDPHWDHGFVRWETCSHAAIRYCCKYITKAVGDDTAQAFIRMSKKPPLGAEYFQRRALEHVKQGLSPQDLFYSWSDVKNTQGKVIKFRLHNVSAYMYVEYFVKMWKALNGNDNWPTSELVQDWLDKKIRDELEKDYDEATELKRLEAKPFKQKAHFPFISAPGGAEPLWSDRLNSYYVWDGGERWFWSYNEEGQRAWTRMIVSESGAERRVESVIVRERFEEKRRNKMSQ